MKILIIILGMIWALVARYGIEKEDVVAHLEQPPTIEEIVCQFDWPCEEALAVAWCESRFDPSAVGAYGVLGLFQLWPGWFQWAGTDISMWDDPLVNSYTAYRVWASGRGWAPWTCKP